MFQYILIGFGVLLAWPLIKKYLPAAGTLKKTVAKAQSQVAETVDLTNIGDDGSDQNWFELMKSWKHLRDCTLAEHCTEATRLLDDLFPHLNAIKEKQPIVDRSVL